MVAERVVRALSLARISDRTAFITTPVMYANGTSVVVRIDEAIDGYFVSDDGHGALMAELMGGLPSFVSIAPSVAQRAGVEFDQRSFFVLKVTEDQLVAAVAIVANTSAVAVERTIYALDQIRVKRSRTTFESRLRMAFQDHVRFGAEIRGATRPWKVDAIVLRSDKGAQSVFEFVPPQFTAVAAAHMKLGDIRSIDGGVHTTAVLADYDKTEAPLRAILSAATDRVIAADQPPEEYAKAA